MYEDKNINKAGHVTLMGMQSIKIFKFFFEGNFIRESSRTPCTGPFCALVILPQMLAGPSKLQMENRGSVKSECAGDDAKST